MHLEGKGVWVNLGYLVKPLCSLFPSFPVSVCVKQTTIYHTLLMQN